MEACSLTREGKTCLVKANYFDIVTYTLIKLILLSSIKGESTCPYQKASLIPQEKMCRWWQRSAHCPKAYSGLKLRFIHSENMNQRFPFILEYTLWGKPLLWTHICRNKPNTVPRKPKLAPEENLLNVFWHRQKPHLEKQIYTDLPNSLMRDQRLNSGKRKHLKVRVRKAL